MSESPARDSIAISPCHVVFQDGLDRMLKLYQPEPFSLIVNGNEVQSTVAEVVLLSPLIYDEWQTNPSERSFCFETGLVDSAAVTAFLEWVFGRWEGTLSEENELKFLRCCTLLGNDRLGLFILSSMHSGQMDGMRNNNGSNFGCLIDLCASQLAVYSASELRCLSKQTVHDLLSSPLIAIESEDDFLRVLIDIDSETFEYLRYVEAAFLSSDGLSRYAQLLPFDYLTSDIWATVVLCLQGASSDDARMRSFRLPRQVFGKSCIISRCPVPLQQFSGKKWNLLYRGTRDGFRSSDFHGKCDGYANTVTLILSTNGSVFGGFTSVPWASSGGYQADQTPESFLFRVKHPANGDQIVCPISDKQKAISCGGSLGPTFGFGYDLHVANNCHMTTSSYSKLGSSYRNDTGLSSELALAGQCHFKVKEIEVFSIDL